MPDDELPHMSSRDDPLSSHVEFIGPFQRTHVILNGFEVPNLTVHPADEGESSVSLCWENRLCIDVPKSHVDRVVAFVADVIASERGYPCWPRTPEEQFMEKRPPFGAVWHAVDGGGDNGSTEATSTEGGEG